MRGIAAAVLVATVAACAGPRPDAPREAAVEAPATWRQPATLGEPSADWWAGFGDAALADAVRTALAHNDDVAIALTRVQQAQAQFRIARAALFPTVDVQGQGARQRDVSPFGMPRVYNAAETDLAVSYELDLFGRVRDTTEAARAAYFATAAAHDNVRLMVASSTASAYITLVAYDARLAVLRETLRARQESLRVTQRRAATGYASQLDLAQAESEMRSTEAQIPPAELAVSQQENGLSVLLGASPRTIPRARALVDLSVPTVPVVLPSDLLRRRPDIAEAELQIVSADKSLDAARAAFMPQIGLSLSAGYLFSSLLNTPVRVFTLGGSVLAPIFEGGRLRAQADSAAAKRDEAAFGYRKTVLTAFQEVENALARNDRYAAQERALAAQRESLVRTVRIATNRYRTGYSAYLEQLDAERALLSADLSLVQVRADRLGAAVSLYKALGGGWKAGG